MNEVEFCEHYCGELTIEQIEVLKHKIKTGTFLGVARCLAGMAFMPAFKGYHPGAWKVIDRCGYSQLAASDGRRLYKEDWHITEYYNDRTKRSHHGH